MATEQKLVCIRDKSDPNGYYRTTRQIAAGIIQSAHVSEEWCYTTKGAWRRNNGKRIEL
jgi:hypothetical protein